MASPAPLLEELVWGGGGGGGDSKINVMYSSKEGGELGGIDS